MNSSKKFDLIGFYDIDKESSEELSKKEGYNYFSNLDSLLSNVDAVDIDGELHVEAASGNTWIKLQKAAAGDTARLSWWNASGAQRAQVGSHANNDMFSIRTWDGSSIVSSLEFSQAKGTFTKDLTLSLIHI